MSPFVAEPWSEDVLSALAELERPSRPLPLAHSQPAGPDRYVIERSVEETRAAYESGKGVLPEGSSVSREGPILVVRAPFTETGLIFSNASAGCMYSMLRGPTIEIDGFAPIGSVRTFAPVAIETQDLVSGKPKNLLVSELWQDAKPWLVIAGRLDEGKGKKKSQLGTIVQSTFRAAQERGDDFDPPRWPARFSLEDEGCRVEIDAPDSLVAIRARRTHSACALMADLAGAGQ